MTIQTKIFNLSCLSDHVVNHLCMALRKWPAMPCHLSMLYLSINLSPSLIYWASLHNMKTTINTILWSHGLTSDLHLFGKELEPAMIVYGNVCHHFLLSPSLLSWSNHGNHDLHPYIASPHQPYTPTPPPFLFSSPFSFPMPLNGIDLGQMILSLHPCAPRPV
jgi:hypothetical protein